MKIILNHKSNLTYKEIINYYKEYKELEYRIECGQLYQQNELDKIKDL